MEVIAKVKGITYQPFLGKELPVYPASHLSNALSNSTAFIHEFEEGQRLAISVWLTPKRTRSYPYARVYNTLSFGGRKATIVPLVKDEGRDGDRDYLQWDTVALMGLLGVYVIPAFYADAEAKPSYTNKITEQLFDAEYVSSQLRALQYYHSSALHWNLEQFDRLPDIGQRALEAYQAIHTKLGVDLPSLISLPKKIIELRQGREEFLEASRTRSRSAQLREVGTIQPKEFFNGEKASITITDLVGGTYYLTADHSEVIGNQLKLVESKHSSTASLPAEDDIKDGLLKLALFANLTETVSNGVLLKPQPLLRLASGLSPLSLTPKQKELLALLEKEAEANRLELDIPNY